MNLINGGKVSFLAGLTVAQISESWLILGALGVSLGHISAETMGLITLLGSSPSAHRLISPSTNMIIHSHPLYECLAPWFKFFERRQPYREAGQPILPDDAVPLAILFEPGRCSSGISRALRKRGWQVPGVHFHPDLVRAVGVVV